MAVSARQVQQGDFVLRLEGSPAGRAVRRNTFEILHALIEYVCVAG